MPAGGDDTSYRVRCALTGSREDLDWIVRRFSPLLRAQAAYRLGRSAPSVDPDDVVAEAWLVALQRSEDLSPRDDRLTPVLLAFLSRVVTHIAQRKLRNLARRYRAAAEGLSDGGGRLETEAAVEAGGPAEACRQEIGREISDAIHRLEDKDREVVILRGIENLSNEQAAHEIGEPPNTVAQRYRRALQKLRSAIPRSVFDDLVNA